MKRILALACIVTAVAASPAMAITDDECAAAWARADVNKDGVVTVAEDSQYFVALRLAGKPIDEGKLSYARYLRNCQTGVLTTAAPDAVAPFAGANSFTESQARDRAVADGLTNVSSLQKDDNGVWRGTATKGSITTRVAVDYQGNVVLQ